MLFADAHSGHALCRDRLAQRRNIIVQTLDYLDAERRNLDVNRVWIAPSSQRKRRDFLDEIHAWYDAELQQINAALEHPDEPQGEKNPRSASSRRLA
jgi:hypothetical protein